MILWNGNSHLRAKDGSLNRFFHSNLYLSVLMEINKMKTCSRCKKEKPVTEFGKCIKLKDGLKGACKKCSNKDSRDSKNRANGVKVPYIQKLNSKGKKVKPGYKECPKCLKEKVLSDFGKNKLSRDNLGFSCKSCCSQATQESNTKSINEVGYVNFRNNKTKILREHINKRRKIDIQSLRQEKTIANQKWIKRQKEKDLAGYLATVSQKSRKYTYGLTNEEFEGLKNDQSHKCEICGIDFEELNREPCVDHDHTLEINGKVTPQSIRGLLCASCNSGLGYFKDDIHILLSAATYIETHTNA